jgi:hypothetical protein
MISVFSAITVASFRTDNQPLGILTGAVTLFFLRREHAGGYMESRRHNALMMRRCATGSSRRCRSRRTGTLFSETTARELRA